MPDSQRLMVTGASGFVGAHLVRELLDRGFEVVAALRAGSDLGLLQALLGDRPYESVRLELLALNEHKRVLRTSGVGAVVHAAAVGVNRTCEGFIQAFETNVQGTLKLCQAALDLGMEHFLLVGTGYEYGDTPGPVDEDAPLRPKGTYAITKAAASMLALEYAVAEDLPLTILRPFSLYGPGQHPRYLVPSLIRAATTGTAVELSPGAQVRDFLHVDDFVTACARVLENPAIPRASVFNVASGKPMTLRALGRKIAQLAGSSEHVYRWGALPYRAGELMRVEADARRLTELTGWLPTVSLEAGLRTELANKKLPNPVEYA